MKKLSSFIFGMMLLSSSALAVPEVLTEPMKEMLKHSPSIPSVTNIVLSTMFMVAIIYLVAFTYQKLSNFNTEKFSGNGEKAYALNKLKVINCLPLGTNKTLHIVEVNEKYLVLGSTQTQISLLKEFDKKDLNKIIESPVTTSKAEKVNLEVIEEGLKTLFPKEELTEEPKEKEKESVDFEEIYKKYI